MEEDKDKNINFLSNDTKSKKIKTSKKIENDEYEPEMVRPDSEKLKKARGTNISGSNISFFNKISNWLGSKFNITKLKKEEKPRIQELQELVGKGQHVGEIMINDEEVLPDEEREEVIKKVEDLPLSKDKKVKTDDSSEDKNEEKVVFITKEDQEIELLREKDKANANNKEDDKNIATPQDISLAPNKDVKIPKAEDGIYSMPQSLTGISLPEPIEEQVDTVEKEAVMLTEKSGPSLWNKVKAFFSGMFSPKAKEVQIDEAEEDKESVLSYELRRFAQEQSKEKEEKEYVVSTQTEDFASGLQLMQQEEVKEELEELGSSLEEKAPSFFNKEVASAQPAKEELSKAQEELFSEVPEQVPELEDIFSSIDQPDKVEPESVVQEPEPSGPSLWDKVKAFFSGMFGPKAKEIQLDETKEEESIEEPVEEIVESESKVEELEVELPESTPVSEEQNIALEEVPELEPDKAQVEEVVIEPEVAPTVASTEEQPFLIPEDQGVQESLPKSLTEPGLEEISTAEVSEEDKLLAGTEQKVSFFTKLKDFFRKLFRAKEKEIELDRESVNGDFVALDDAPEGTNNEESVGASDDESTDSAENEEPIDGDQSAIVDYYKIKNNKKSKEVKEVIEEAQLSTKFHQPSISTVVRLIDEEGGVDLIPIAIRTKSWIQIAQLLAAAIVGSVIMALSFYATLYFQQINLEKEKEIQQNQISDLDQRILDYKEMNEEIDTLGKDIAIVYDLFNKHIYWTNLFELIEKYTLEDVYFSGFSAGAGGALNFNATGKSYDTAARQLKLLQSEEAKEFITSVNINSVSGGGDSVSFSISLILNDKLFYYSE